MPCDDNIVRKGASVYTESFISPIDGKKRWRAVHLATMISGVGQTELEAIQSLRKRLEEQEVGK